MDLSPADSVIYRFPGWELRVHEHLLLVQDKPAKIGRPAFNLLLALIRGQGRVVDKDALMTAAWPDRVVEENNLSVQIAALRKLLGSAAIVNVSGLGYRLAAALPPPDAAPSAGRAAPRPCGSAPMLFGRDADLAALLRLVADVSLVTVVGTGGVGKTSLAKAVTARSETDWSDGVHWIDLAPLRSGAPLLQLIAKSLGVLSDDLGRLSDEFILSLSPLKALIVVDNCEHLTAEVAALLGPLLHRAPGLHWLATSQEPLRLDGEFVYRLAPLDLPQPGDALSQAVASGALALFCERARGTDRKFELGPERLELAIELCRHLDGLPLAIEMAAARVATLGLQGVHDQIDQRLRLRAVTRDAPVRHHTLLQTFEWSYGLLSPVEQRVFRRLEPFLGGFTAQMAQRLCCSVEGGPDALDSWAMLDALSALVEKSLVQRSPATATLAGERLHLLESARDFARLQLAAAGETASMQQRHAEIVADWFDSAQYDFERWPDQDWCAKYLPERRNVCAALGWVCSTHEPELLARLVAALAHLDNMGLAPGEVVHYPVPLAVLDAAPLPLRARAYSEFGWAHFYESSRQRGTDLLLRALADFETLGDVAGTYGALLRLIRFYQGRPGMQAQARAMWARLQQIDEREVPLRSRLVCAIAVTHYFLGGRSVEQLRQLHQVARHAGYDRMALACGLNITDVLLIDERFDEAAETAQSLLRHGDTLLGLHAYIRHNQALALVRLGRSDEARVPALALLRTLPSADHFVMDLFAFAALQSRRWEDAALMAGRSAQIKRDRALHSEAAEAAMIAATECRLKEELGPQRAAEFMELGAVMSNAEVLKLALQP